MSTTIKNIEYRDNTDTEFSEAVYQLMASKRFGINFCCEKDLLKHSIDKELLQLNDIMNADLTPTDCSD